MSDHAELAVAFARTASDYERGRPGYPGDLLAEIGERVGFGPGCRVLDLAAGTGKLTRQLVATGADVVAVEPLAEMRIELARVLPDVANLDGSAESIPLGDASVDVVTVGQAYHWFDQGRANPEVARVLRPGGHLVALWNFEDTSVPWVDELESIKAFAGNDRRPTPGGEGSTVRRRGWEFTFADGPWFDAPTRIDGSMSLTMTTDQLVASFTSRSYVSLLDDAARAPLLDRVRALVADFDEPFAVPYITHAYLCRRTSATPS